MCTGDSEIVFSRCLMSFSRDAAAKFAEKEKDDDDDDDDDDVIVVVIVVCLFAWLCGCVVVWLCGCVVVWLCGCVSSLRTHASPPPSDRISHY